jgi:hypothetical protein
MLKTYASFIEEGVQGPLVRVGHTLQHLVMAETRALDLLEQGNVAVVEIRKAHKQGHEQLLEILTPVECLRLI